MPKDNEFLASEIKKVHDGELQLGSGIKCFVIEFKDDREPIRLLSGRAVTNAFSLTGRGQGMSRFTSSERIAPKMADRLREAIQNPVRFPITPGLPKALGYESWVLPELCNAILDAHEESPLPKNQQKVAVAAKLLSRGLAITGITALVDEATGFQELRDRKALQAILDRFLRKERAAWAKRFPDEFYQEMFRLRGWTFQKLTTRRSPLVGLYTNDLVYERLAPDLLIELEERNPKDEKGHRKHRHHQWLTEDVGHPKLAQHLYAVIGLMRASGGWEHFYRMMQRAFPKRNTTLLLPIADTSEEE